MIAAPAIGVAPTSEVNFVTAPKAVAAATGFASIMQAVVPADKTMVVQPEAQFPPILQSVDIGPPAVIESMPEGMQLAGKIAKSLLPEPIVVDDVNQTDCIAIVFHGGALPLGFKPIGLPTDPEKNVPEKNSDATKTSPDDEPLDIDQIVFEPTEQVIVARYEFEQRAGAMPAVGPNPEKQVAILQIGAPLPERIAVADVSVPKLTIQVDRVEVQTSLSPVPRDPIFISTHSADKSQPHLVERGPVFAPMLMQIARDVMALSADRDVRFNVRPDILGPVAVTIERTEVGQSLRLSVETPAAVQAVRQAEPMLNDSRNAAPFVQVTVDLNAPDQRSRHHYRPSAQPRHADGRPTDIVIKRVPVVTGRYA